MFKDYGHHPYPSVHAYTGKYMNRMRFKKFYGGKLTDRRSAGCKGPCPPIILWKSVSDLEHSQLQEKNLAPPHPNPPPLLTPMVLL